MNERRVKYEYDRLCRRAFAQGRVVRVSPRHRWRVNWLVFALCVAALAWFVIRAIALRRGL